MSEQIELTKIERELVLQYLRDDNVPLTVTLEEKPVMAEIELNENKTQDIPDYKVSMSAVFPVAIPAKQIEVYDEGIILLKNTSRITEQFLGKNVKIQFYFNRLGLYFNTVMKECSKGLAIVVPQQIFRITEKSTAPEYDFSAAIGFTSSDNEKISYECVPLSGFTMFSQPKWAEIDSKVQVEAKNLLEKILIKIKQENKPISNGVFLLSAVRYLTQKEFTVVESFESQNNPLTIIYADNEKMLVTANKDTDLVLDQLYEGQLNFTLTGNKLIKRTIMLSFKIDDVYLNEDKKCYLVLFENVKQEDKRFLYERATGKIFNE